MHTCNITNLIANTNIKHKHASTYAQVRDCKGNLCSPGELWNSNCNSGEAPSGCDYNCMAYFYDYGDCSITDQKGSAAKAVYNKYVSTLVPTAMMYWHIWDRYTEHFPFSHGPACQTPDAEVFSGAKPCRHEQLFDNVCDWECYHETCDFDFFGNDSSSSMYTEWDNFCGRPIFKPDKTETMIQFEINNYDGKTPIPDLNKAEVPDMRTALLVEKGGCIPVPRVIHSKESVLLIGI